MDRLLVKPVSLCGLESVRQGKGMEKLGCSWGGIARLIVAPPASEACSGSSHT